SPDLDLFDAFHDPQQIGPSPFLQIGKTVLTQPPSEGSAVAPADRPVRAGDPHRLATADQQCRSNKKPIYPILQGVVFEPRPGLGSFGNTAAAIVRWWDGPTMLFHLVGSAPHQF